MTPSTDTIQLLKDVITKLNNGKAWTQDYYAVDKAGNLCAVDDSRAAKWCLAGAIIHASYRQRLAYSLRAELGKALEHELHVTGIAVWNDDKRRTPKSVMFRLNKVLEKWRGELYEL